MRVVQVLGLLMITATTIVALFSCGTIEECSQEGLTRPTDGRYYQICKNGTWQSCELDPFECMDRLDIPDGACLWIGVPQKGCKLPNGEPCPLTRIVECIPENEEFEKDQ